LYSLNQKGNQGAFNKWNCTFCFVVVLNARQVSFDAGQVSFECWTSGFNAGQVVLMLDKCLLMQDK